ncbi:predicted protein [Nematostella vectensis]|uniref:Uncharacterized protein n=1 Tax=Nematostella vectensis TaxID=45351 RepID=A7RQL4_NEMVE|nr:predicted protein [Nematostella vectensis]|eukprot:XP_001638448.1 predicted protein [Nematostella vectensis]
MRLLSVVVILMSLWQAVDAQRLKVTNSSLEVLWVLILVAIILYVLIAGCKRLVRRIDKLRAAKRHGARRAPSLELHTFQNAVEIESSRPGLISPCNSPIQGADEDMSDTLRNTQTRDDPCGANTANYDYTAPSSRNLDLVTKSLYLSYAYFDSCGGRNIPVEPPETRKIKGLSGGLKYCSLDVKNSVLLLNTVITKREKTRKFVDGVYRVHKTV